MPSARPSIVTVGGRDGPAGRLVEVVEADESAAGRLDPPPQLVATNATAIANASNECERLL
jgi:hypothetical protein